MLKTDSLAFAYDGSRSFNFPDIHLEQDQNLLIIGESGIGKTTLIHLLVGLLKPKSGTVELFGSDITQFSAAELDKFRGKHIGIVFQRPHFVKALTFKENLELIQYFAKMPKNLDRIKQVAENLGLGEKLNQNPYQFSQGEQQRAAIALAVINHPKLIIADEPTANLDDKNCKRVSELLMKQAENTGAQLVIITHDQRLKSEFTNTLEL